MNFAELRFWGYLALGLAVVLAVRWPLRHARLDVQRLFDRTALALLSAFLLLCVGWLTFTIWLIVALGSYAGMKLILRFDPHSPTKYLFVLLPLQLAPLLYYKYADFAVNGVLGLDVPSLDSLVIPVGLSFYIFQKMGFAVDTLAFRQPLPGLLDYLNFAGFFPQIVAGPIERRRDLLPQMSRFRFRWNAAWINEGSTWIALGLFLKLCLANNMANLMPLVLPSTTNPYLIWLANLLFGLRIYYDFAGYSLVAYGLGRCFGVRLTLNFLSPYCASSVQEFWRRWHVTLSQWFRDYVYVPLGGGRVRWWIFNVMLVFIVSGIWHGAGWNFILWGALHGAYLVVQRLGRWIKLPSPLGWAITMLAVGFAWLGFYETRLDMLAEKMHTLLSPSAYNLDALRLAIGTLPAGDLTMLGGLLTMASFVLALELLSLRRFDDPYVALRRPWLLALLVVLTVLLAPGENNAFIYFAF